MKKITKRILILVILITLIMPKFTFAIDTVINGAQNIKRSIEFGEEAYNLLANKGQANVNGQNQVVIDTPSQGDTIASIIAITTSFIAEVSRGLIGAVINEGDVSKTTYFTIADTVTGKYGMLNNNFFESSNSDINSTIKTSVQEWYYGIRNLAIIISLLMLIYIGIRMALSTLSDDKAKYKKMLLAWLQSFVLIFVLHYLMAALFMVQQTLLNILPKDGVNGEAEMSIAVSCWKNIITSNGWNIVWAGILYWILMYYEIKFFLLYMKRVLATAFLMIIAPLITVTYSIDKIGDNKGQALEAWLKEFVVNVFIQPVHLLLYFIFIVSAAKLAEKFPLFTIIFLGALSRSEKIIKGVLGMRERKSISSLGKGKKRG